LREYRQHAFFVRPAERERIKRSVAQKRHHKRFSRFPRTTRRRIVRRRPDLPPIAYEDQPEVTPAPPSLAGQAEAAEQPSETASAPPSETAAEQPSETAAEQPSPSEGSQQPSPSDTSANNNQAQTAKTA
jgi:hypothetical protein